MAKHPTKPPTQVSRRDFLRQSTGAAMAGVVAPSTFAWPVVDGPFETGRKTERVILVAFAGGVRRDEILDTPANVPNLMRIASAGVTLPNVRAANLGHYGAALSIFTGNIEQLGIRENTRGVNPTLFEVLAKDVGIPSSQIWLSTAGGAQGRLFAHSDHPRYGAEYGANVLDGDGIFNVEFKRVLDSFGRPKPDSAGDRALLQKLDAALDGDTLGALRQARPDPAQVRRVERFILDELTGSTTRVTGPGAADAKAIRIAANILKVFKPKVLGITLQSHDIAHGSYNGYVEVIRRNDAEVGKLWDAIQADPELRDTTAIVVLPEFGRDANLNERNGLDHGDRSDSMRKVWMFAAGPDFKSDKIVHDEVRTIDVCPTLYSLFSKRPMPGGSRAKVIRSLFA